MRKTILTILGAFGLLSAGLASSPAYAAAPARGVKKICPDGSTVPYKRACPDYTPPDPVDPTPSADPVSLSVADVTVNESAGNATITVRKLNTTTLTGSFTYSTSNGTATAGSDYSSKTGSGSIASSASSYTFTVPILSDTTDESDETFTVTLVAGTNSVLSDGSATVTITDDDDPPVLPATPSALAISAVSVNESAGTVTMTVSRSGNNSSLAAGFSYSTANNTAVAGQDYTTTSGSGTILAGATTATFTIPITSDTTDESDETFTVYLFAGSNSTVANCCQNVTILDDDSAPLPDPNPTPVGGDVLAESLEGYTWRTVSDHDYLTDLQATGGTGQIPPQYPAGPGITGDYRQVCGVNNLGYFDPILYPGEDGKSHLHDFNGHRGANASSTFDTLLGSGGSSCNWQTGSAVNNASQRSSYWIPALLYNNTQTIRVDWVQLYYKRLPKGANECGNPALGNPKAGICIEIPNGIRAIAGSKMVAGQYGPDGYRTDAVQARATTFKCQEFGVVYKDLADLAAGTPVGQCKKLQASIYMPDCWNGTHLWKTDRSHLVYQRYGSLGYSHCPTTHPYLITQVSIFYVYNVEGLDLTKLKLASDYMNPTQPAGWSLHADMFIAWDARVKRMMHDNCIDKRLDCSGGNLGNGLELKGAQQPSYGWGNPNRLETTPPMPSNMVMP